MDLDLYILVTAQDRAVDTLTGAIRMSRSRDGWDFTSATRPARLGDGVHGEISHETPKKTKKIWRHQWFFCKGIIDTEPSTSRFFLKRHHGLGRIQGSCGVFFFCECRSRWLSF